MYSIYISGREFPNMYRYNEWHAINCPTHCHSEFELIIVLSGELHVEKENKFYTLSKNDTISIMPFENHKLTTTDNSHIAVLEISTDLVSSFDTIFQNKKPENPCCKLTQNKLASILDHLNNAKNTPLIELNCIVFIIFSLILRNSKLIPYNEPTDNFKKAIIYTSTHYEENICLKDVAAALNINHVYLSRLFTKNNITFNDFLNNFRVRKASILLKHSSLNISEICFNCGFGSIRSFNRIFFKAMNCTPKFFRQNVQNLTPNDRIEFL